MDATKKGTLVGPMRPSFLLLTPVCVLLGIATAYVEQGSIPYLYVILILVGALASHISVNAFNEYFDFKSKLDERTQKTPFSGGTGTLQAAPELAPAVNILAWGTLGITVAIGVAFTVIHGPWILPLGLLGILLVYVYTNWITHRPFLCLMSPGLGFGPLMVLGTHFALTGSYSWVAFFASLIPFFLVNNLLLINQFPDVEADITVGRSHYPIVLGRTKSGYIFILFLALTYATLVSGVLFGIFPAYALAGLLPTVLAIPLVAGVLRYSEDIPKLIPYLGKNVAVVLLTPTLVSIGFMATRYLA